MVALAGCGAAMPALPSQDVHWYELTSEHITLWTDASVDRGKDLVREMEEHRAIVARGMNNNPAPARIYALALRSDAETHAFIPATSIAVTMENTAIQAPLIVFYAYDEDHRDKIFTHELTHAVAHGIIRHQPSWLAEGIATYFESAQSHGGGVELGLPRKDRLEAIRRRGLMPTAQLFTCCALGATCDLETFYATSWAMFTFLVNAHFDELSRYLQRLDELPRDADRAWKEVFPAMAPGLDLDHALHDFVAFGKLGLIHFDAPNVQPTTAVREMSVAEVAAGRPAARQARGDKAGALADAAIAERADATGVIAATVHAIVEPASYAPAAAHAVAAAHPDDWRAWRLVMAVDPDAAAKRDAHDKMCAAAARDLSVALPLGLCEMAR